MHELHEQNQHIDINQ